MEDNSTKNNKDMRNPIIGSSSRTPASISYGMIGFVILVFVIGCVVSLISQNIIKGEILTFSTISLVSFLFSIVLGSASIVLAISAIWLGKISEEAMINRSDESIKLQNTIFTKTIEALQRIEASTGVTEKRMEDVIDSVGDISRRVAERAIGDNLITGKKQGLLQEEIRKSILSELTEKRKIPEIDLEKERKNFEISAKYNSFQNDLILALVNDGRLKTKKMGDGSTLSDGEGLADAIFIKDSEKVAISIFTDEGDLGEQYFRRFNIFLEKTILAISEGIFTKMFIVFNGELSTDNKFMIAFDKIKKIAKSDLAEKIYLISGTVSTLKDEIFEKII